MKIFFIFLMLLLSFNLSAEIIPNFLEENGKFINNRLNIITKTICGYCTGPEFPERTVGISFYARDYLAKLGFRSADRMFWEKNDVNQRLDEVFKSLQSTAQSRYNHFGGNWEYESKEELRVMKRFDEKTSCNLFETKTLKLSITDWRGEQENLNGKFVAQETFLKESWTIENGRSCILSRK